MSHRQARNVPTAPRTSLDKPIPIPERPGPMRQLKYALARSIAYFLENGAPKVRFNPFGDVKKKYLDTLLETQDMHKATAAAFPGEEALRKFIVEWDKYFFPGGC